MGRGGICKKRGEMHCFAIRIKQNLCRQSKDQYSLDPLKYILSTLDSAEDMQTFCIGQSGHQTSVKVFLWGKNS